MRKISAGEQTKLHAAVEAARASTSARFDLVIVPAADRYALYPIAFGAFAALIAGGALALFWAALSLRDAFVIEVVVFVLASLAFEWLPLKLLLVPRRIRHERARQMAHRAYAARILAAHERRDGMVFFVALGERYVELVTDDSLDRRIGQQRWNAIVAELTQGAKRGDLSNAIGTAIAACGRELAQHFPK